LDNPHRIPKGKYNATANGKRSTTALLKIELNLSEIPMYIRYEKRNQRFYVKPPNELCHYFKKYDPEESLKQSIEYMNK
jgi:hypothetical protein